VHQIDGLAEIQNEALALALLGNATTVTGWFGTRDKHINKLDFTFEEWDKFKSGTNSNLTNLAYATYIKADPGDNSFVYFRPQPNWEKSGILAVGEDLYDFDVCPTAKLNFVSGLWEPANGSSSTTTPTPTSRRAAGDSPDAPVFAVESLCEVDRWRPLLYRIQQTKGQISRESVELVVEPGLTDWDFRDLAILDGTPYLKTGTTHAGGGKLYIYQATWTLIDVHGTDPGVERNFAVAALPRDGLRDGALYLHVVEIFMVLAAKFSGLT